MNEIEHPIDPKDDPEVLRHNRNVALGIIGFGILVTMIMCLVLG